ncbi:MAG TPA: hypothetical protein VHK69_17485, partial [Chitinophagaceae bacterium]|nr:hypothetical protein [Chitinophagaceae bacterium]
MILHCDTRMHPLRHSGTGQGSRLLQALLPENLRLDNRSTEDLLAFAAQMAGHVRYWNPEHKEGGDWTSFWESDATALLAIVAATDLDTPRTLYRSKELEYHRLRRKEERGQQAEGEPSSTSIVHGLVQDPVYGIYGLALAIVRICEKAPEGHTLRKEIAGIIESKLQGPLHRLIQFHKAVDPQAVRLYQPFVGEDPCARPWGLPNQYTVECIDFLLPYEYMEELWKLFLQFFKVLSLIVDKAKRAFQSALRTRNDHQPHICLFLSFLHLFRYLQEDLNGLTEKHLQYYYRDILRLQAGRLIPDKVHVVFELAQNVHRHRLAKGTGLKGGMDFNGKPMTYVLQEELVAGRVK